MLGLCLHKFVVRDLAESMSDFAAGGLAGCVEALFVHPLDMVKTRHQLNHGKNESIARSLGNLVKEGGVPRLYRGLAPELGGMLATRAAMFGTYATAQRALWQAGLPDNSGTAGLAGLVAGVPEAIVTTPFQLVKVRMQAKNNVYKGTLDCASSVIKNEGVVALSHGLNATMWRNSVWNGVFFAVIRQLDGHIPSELQGFVAGWIATVFNAPFDVAKSRAQSAAGGAGGRGPIQVLGDIIRTEGPGGIYKGFWPKSLRMAIGGGVSAAAYKVFAKLLGAEGTS